MRMIAILQIGQTLKTLFHLPQFRNYLMDLKFIINKLIIIQINIIIYQKTRKLRKT